MVKYLQLLKLPHVLHGAKYLLLSIYIIVERTWVQPQRYRHKEFSSII
jgi:hypothetical protein